MCVGAHAQAMNETIENHKANRDNDNDELATETTADGEQKKEQEKK